MQATSQPPGDRWVLTLDGGGRIVAASGAAVAWVGFSAARLSGRSIWEVAAPTRRRDRLVAGRKPATALDRLAGTSFPAELQRADGSTTRVELRVDIPTGPDAPAYEVAFVDAARAPQPAAVAEPAAEQDAVEPPAETGVAGATERAFADRLQRALQDRTPGASAALVRVRVIDLPLITGALGREAGDAVLEHVRGLVADALPGAAAFGMVPGGHVCVVLTGLEGNGTADALSAANAVVERLTGTTTVDGEEVRLTSAVGVALAPRDGEAAEELLSAAERATRPVDGIDCARVRLATPVGGGLRDTLRLRTRLEGVAERGELRLVYQPIFDLETMRPYGVEALLRWEDPERGLIPPASFIPVAEETGAIEQLGTWVVEELCRHAFAWRSDGIDLQLHFNVSPIELRRRGFAARVLSIIRAYRLDPARFTLEVTESTIVLDGDAAVPTLQQLRADGMQVAIDDFGAGHSSLARLRELPADMLKITRALVTGLPDRGSHELVSAALRIAEGLDLRAAASGIESEDQQRILVELGCPFGQGFALGRPSADAPTAPTAPAWSTPVLTAA